MLCDGCQLCHHGLDCSPIESMLPGGSDVYYRRLLSKLGELQDLSDRFALAAAQESVAAVKNTAACASVFAEWECAWIFHARLAGIATLRAGLAALLEGKDPVGQRHAKTGKWERLCADCSGLEPVRDYKERSRKGGKGSRTPLWLCAECAGLRRDGLQVRGVGGDRYQTLIERGARFAVVPSRSTVVSTVCCPVESVVSDSVSSPLPACPPPPASRVSRVWHSVPAVQRGGPCATWGGSAASQCPPRVLPNARRSQPRRRRQSRGWRRRGQEGGRERGQEGEQEGEDEAAGTGGNAAEEGEGESGR